MLATTSPEATTTTNLQPRSKMDKTQTIFVDPTKVEQLSAARELLLHTRLFLYALIKGRYRDRLLRLWTLFVLIAPLLGPVILRVMRDAGVLVTEDVRLENATYPPMNVSDLSRTVVDGWRADASRLGFGPSNDDLAMNLSRSVCDRLGVDFALTRKILDDKEAENARVLPVDGIVMFMDGGKVDSFKIYHENFQQTTLQAARTYAEMLQGHRFYVGEVAAISGLLDLQGAANQVCLDCR